MARPRVFISSTFYDLRQVRADLERFVKDLGYEPVLHEKGGLAYGSEERLEEYAYKEIDLCDILVSIVGGRFGTQSEGSDYSISQRELRRALELGKAVYIFVERGVRSEYLTYLNNKDVKGIRYQHVDNNKIYVFLEEVEALPNNNPIHSFETSAEIAEILKGQWAGLFQRFLSEKVRVREGQLLEGMQATAKTLDQLVKFLTEERQSQDGAIKEILLSNHPAFEAFRKATNTSYRIFFTNREEFEAWMTARSFRKIDEFAVESWEVKGRSKTIRVNIHTDLFDESGKLRVLSAAEWDESWVTQEEVLDDDDIPF